jgi:transposase-like protein
MPLKITHSVVQSQQCIFCGARAIKHGLRKNIFNTIQKFQCPKCKKIFSIDRNKRMRYPFRVREWALRLNKSEGL